MNDRFSLVLIEGKDRRTGKGTTLYEGDDADACIRAAASAAEAPENSGKLLRFHDYLFFGGSIRDLTARQVREETSDHQPITDPS